MFNLSDTIVEQRLGDNIQNIQTTICLYIDYMLQHLHYLRPLDWRRDALAYCRNARCPSAWRRNEALYVRCRRLPMLSPGIDQPNTEQYLYVKMHCIAQGHSVRTDLYANKCLLLYGVCNIVCMSTANAIHKC